LQPRNKEGRWRRFSGFPLTAVRGGRPPGGTAKRTAGTSPKSPIVRATTLPSKYGLPRQNGHD